MHTQDDFQIETEKESEGKILFELNTLRSSREFHEEDVQDKKFDSISVKEEEFGIKFEFEAVPYTGEPFVEPEFVLPEEVGVMVGSEEKGQYNMQEFHEEDVQDKKFVSMSVKEAVPYTGEPFVEPEFLSPKEIGVMVGSEEKGQYNTQLSIVRNGEGHKPTNESTADWIYSPNPNNSPTFKCVRCSYQAKRKLSISRHVLTHMPKTIECPHCFYMTNSEHNLNRHQLVHVPKKTATLNKCPKRPYMSKRKGYKKPEETTWYKCPDCTYKTKRKWDLTHRHMLIHRKNPSLMLGPTTEQLPI